MAIKINIKKLEKAYGNYVCEEGKLASELQKYSEIEIYILYQPSDGFCVGAERVETSGAPMNMSIYNFIRIAEKGEKLTEDDLNAISI